MWGAAASARWRGSRGQWVGTAGATPEGLAAVVGREQQTCLCRTGGGGAQITDGLRGRSRTVQLGAGGWGWGGKPGQCLGLQARAVSVRVMGKALQGRVGPRGCWGGLGLLLQPKPVGVWSREP